MSSLESRLHASPYLRRLQNTTQLELTSIQKEGLSALEAICSELESMNIDDPQSCEQTLVQAKTDFSFAWSVAELFSIGSQAQRGALQTRFAEATIDFALRIAWVLIAHKQRALQPTVLDSYGRVPGLFVLGMGKLGGYDLNFSSDVDLVAYFDADRLPVPDMLGKSYICHQVLQRLTALLGQNGQSNFIWRVDWRLRPNASATTLAMAMQSAFEYYFYQASPWHRLALMKARVVAGDISLGQTFLSDLTPFIWRQNLDYRALDELAEIKQRINLEHPSLRTQRQWREPITDDIAGFNLKLGSGGIREIEFIANALQLVWGGRITELRHPNTVQALDRLARNQRIDETDAQRLKECYQTLRTIENAIQIYDNQQTHLIPASETGQQALLVLLGLQSWADLVMTLNTARRFVNQSFSSLFAEQSSAHQDPIVWPKGLSPQADEIVEAWESGYHIYGVSNQVRHRLIPLTRGIANYLNESDEHIGDSASDTIVRLHDFFRALPSGEQYFRLLAESPVLLRSIVPPLLHSPPMTTLLRQSPHIIDCYVQGDWSYPEPFDSDFVTETDNYEERLERKRRFVNEYLYQLYLRFLQGKMEVSTFQQALTHLAEESLQLALKVVAEEMDLSTVPISVIGMGKLALRRMSPLSDLDLIFIYEQSQTEMDLASRFVSRLQTAIAAPMKEGILYELDTRLRPSGRSGAPTVSVESFANHHLQRARTWEHIALVPSRMVAGNSHPEAEINRIKRAIIETPRDQEQMLCDAIKMWHRIAEHRVIETPPQIMNSKLRVGGLMQAEYLASCLVLKFGHQRSASSLEFDTLLAEYLPGTGMEELPDIIQFWRTQQLWERLLGKTDQPISSLRNNYFERLLAQSGVDSMDALISTKRRYTEAVVSGLNDLFADVAMSKTDIEDWQETPVKWA